MNIQEIVSTCVDAGLMLSVKNDKLAVKGDKDVIARFSSLLRSHKETLKAYLVEEPHDLTYIATDIEERAAIIEHEAGIPGEWAEAFARMEAMQRPASISPNRWQQIINNMGLCLDNYVQELITHYWTVADVFSCHKGVPEKRYDDMGLLLLLGNAQVVRVEADKITLRTPSGALQSFYRAHLGNPAERVMIWELDNTGKFEK